MLRASAHSLGPEVGLEHPRELHDGESLGAALLVYFLRQLGPVEVVLLPRPELLVERPGERTKSTEKKKKVVSQKSVYTMGSMYSKVQKEKNMLPKHKSVQIPTFPLPTAVRLTFLRVWNWKEPTYA